jgi:hypothetical protein
MDPQQAREYRDRWQEVAAIEAAEQRAASIELRWRQLNAILQMAMDLGLPLDRRQEGEEEVWLRWARLKGET